MGILDNYYRGFKDYRKITADDKACQRDRRIYKKSGLEFDKLEITKYFCTIEEDWIIAIEKGLEFVEKAVKEERQFITTNGEIVPIEKAKKVSKDTVAHLARHANLITRVPEEGENIIPDKLYMVEKLSDFAVYENRFLYMLLCYLRDFINLRLEKIQKLRMTYTCYLKLKKNYDSKKRKLDFDTEFSEKRYDNPYPIADEKCEGLIKRIEDIQQIVTMLLNTNLMQEVSKAAMLKPPITKTNVLKMNNNFKNSLALYDYIVTYKGDGFTSEEIKKDFAPLSDVCADELAEIATLTSFLTYKMGNEIEEVLERAYQEEENRRKKLEADKLLEQIRLLKKRVLESGMGMEEYMLALEKRNRLLEADSIALIQARNEIIELNKKIEELNQEIIGLNRKIESLNQEIDDLIKEIARLNQKYIDDMAALKKKHEEEINMLNAQHEEEINDLNEEHEIEISRIEKRHEENVEYLNSRHLDEIAGIKANYNEQIAELNDKLAVIRGEVTAEYESLIEELNNKIQQKAEELNNEVASYNEKIDSLNSDINELNNQRLLLIDDYENKLNELKNNFKYEYDSMVNEKNSANNELQGVNNDLVERNKLLSAELNGLRYQNGLLKPCEDYTSRERFEELEKEFIAFNDFFKKQWQLTKKQIRKMLLWNKEEEKAMIEKEKRLKLERKAEKARLKQEEKQKKLEEKNIDISLSDDTLNQDDSEITKENLEARKLEVVEEESNNIAEELLEEVLSETEEIDVVEETNNMAEQEAIEEILSDNLEAEELDLENTEIKINEIEADNFVENTELIENLETENKDNLFKSEFEIFEEENIYLEDEQILDDLNYEYDENQEEIIEEIIYVDEDGNPIDIEDIDEIIEK